MDLLEYAKYLFHCLNRYVVKRNSTYSSQLKIWNKDSKFEYWWPGFYSHFKAFCFSIIFIISRVYKATSTNTKFVCQLNNKTQRIDGNASNVGIKSHIRNGLLWKIKSTSSTKHLILQTLFTDSSIT